MTPIDWIANVDYPVAVISLVVLLTALMLPWLSVHLSRHSKKVDQAMKYAVLGAYILANLSETLLFRSVAPEAYVAPGILWSYREAMEIRPELRITNVELFQEIVLNVLLYVPLGYLLPFTFPKLRLWQVVLLGLLCSVGTELIQFSLHIGMLDVDDILNNTLGCVIGVIIYIVWMRWGRRSRRDWQTNDSKEPS